MKTMVYVANSREGGIAAFELDRDDGRLGERGRYLEKLGVSPLAADPNRRFLYAALHSETDSLAAFAVDSGTGEPHLLNTVDIPGKPTYLHVSGDGRFLLGVSYGGDFIGVWALGREGMVQPEPACLLRRGRNPHCIVLDRAGRFAYVPMLGNDTVALYRFDAVTGILFPLASGQVSTARESGPRHMVLSPDNRFAYLLTELGGEVVKFDVNAEDGLLTEAHAAPILPPDRALPPGKYEPPVNASGGGNSPTPVMWAADIRMTPDSRFLYVSERTNSTLTCFAVDPVSGRLDMRGVFETEAQPRGIAVEPFGRFLVAAGERSGGVASYGIEASTGRLSVADRRESGAAPNWVEVVALH